MKLLNGGDYSVSGVVNKVLKEKGYSGGYSYDDFCKLMGLSATEKETLAYYYFRGLNQIEISDYRDRKYKSIKFQFNNLNRKVYDFFNVSRGSYGNTRVVVVALLLGQFLKLGYKFDIKEDVKEDNNLKGVEYFKESLLPHNKRFRI